MSAADLEKEVDMQELVCCFCPNPHCPGEGYYRIETMGGEFLGNVGAEDLGYELSVLRKNISSLVRIVGGEAAC